MSGYGPFAQFYDQLTANVDYAERARFFSDLIRRFTLREPAILLDLACGTGSLSYALAELGYDVIGVDSSPEMLSRAMAKGGESPPLFLCQMMQALDLYGTVDACVCALDSLNHLPDSVALHQVFDRVSLFLAPGGVFAFDINTEHKHRRVLADNAFVYEMDEVFCVWRNFCRENGTVDIALDFFAPDAQGRYHRSSEGFSEQLFSHRDILAALDAAGLEFLAICGDGDMNPPDESTERVVYAARKPE